MTLLSRVDDLFSRRRVVDHLLHISYDERRLLRLTATSGDEESITALGKALFGAKPGESLRLRGSWVQHHRHGGQFKVEHCERTMPADERAIRVYLVSGMIRGIGPTLASAIVDAFGEQTLKIIDSEPHRLLAVHNIGAIRLGRITAAWLEQKAIAEIMVFLQQLGITPGLAVKIYATSADTDDDPIELAVGNTLEHDEFEAFAADLVIVDAPWGLHWAR